MRMTVTDMIGRLTAHGVPDWMYTVGSLGGGEIDGIAQRNDGTWITYYSERGAMRSIKEWPSEAEATADLFAKVEKFARFKGVWKDIP
ncbi:hypothetical protein [Actibacterium sp. 188UL27-1]|uniref:hypothetical protein n=1 Tax=Actibacterium sp. 188UL27-1 TaxID=2786961 RepID=UPI00195DD9C8|nr:hypothetical protein [Actibacterium sp. 188UL27-1]MBM7065965.1 hypothetical protein [Actibacterium sp. 188UL27-1]